MMLWDNALKENPLIAILRGLDPSNAVDVIDILVESGFRLIEVPLNSPNPLSSIELIARKFEEDIVVGAGTVMTTDDASAVWNAGGQLIVAPNMDPRVGARGVGTGCQMVPRRPDADRSVFRIGIWGFCPEDISGGASAAKGNLRHACCPAQ